MNGGIALEENKNPTLILADGSEYEYTLGGAVSSIGDMYIDIPNLTMSSAFSIFSDIGKTKHMEFWAGGSVSAFDGYTVLGGVEVPYNLPNTVRITMRRGADITEESLAAAQAEAAQYKAALALLGIETEGTT